MLRQLRRARVVRAHSLTLAAAGAGTPWWIKWVLCLFSMFAGQEKKDMVIQTDLPGLFHPSSPRAAAVGERAAAS
jgi:hypothetical protein